jgi:hypothetical protein
VSLARSRPAWRVAAVLCGGGLSASACVSSNDALPPVVLEAGQVSLRYDGPDEVCRGTAAYLDAVADEFYARLGTSPAGDARIDYVWTYPNGVDDYCDEGYACAQNDRESNISIVFADAMPDLHEMVHATHFRVWPDSVEVLEEGLAETWGSIQPDQRWPASVAVADLFPSVDGGAEYVASHHVVYQTLEAAAWPAFEELWRTSSVGASQSEFEMTYATKVGIALDAVLAESTQTFGCVVPACVGERVSVSPDGTFMLAASPGCDDDATIGSDSADSLLPLRRAYVIEGHAPGLFGVALPPDTGDESVVVFRECDAVCHGDVDEQVVDGQAVDRVQLAGIATEVMVWTQTPSSGSVIISPVE